MKPEIKYGIITGLLICLWVMIEYFLGFHTTKFETGKYSGYFATIVPIITIYLLLKNKREFYNNTLTLKQGLRAGTLMSLITAIITTVFFLIYNHYINPGWMQQAMEWEKNNMLKQGLPQAVIDSQLSKFNSMNTDSAQIVQGLIGTIMMGMIISFFMTLTLRRGVELPTN
jgi:hypothetical protein